MIVQELYSFWSCGCLRCFVDAGMSGRFEIFYSLGAPDEVFRLIEQALRDLLFKGAPDEAFRLNVQALRENQAIFAMGGFDALLTLVWAGVPDEAFRPIEQELRDNQAIFATGAFDESLAQVWAGALRVKLWDWAGGFSCSISPPSGPPVFDLSKSSLLHFVAREDSERSRHLRAHPAQNHLRSLRSLVSYAPGSAQSRDLRSRGMF